MEKKKYFKMYKSGKLWVTAALVGFSVMAGVAVNDQQVKADDQTAATQTSPAADNNNDVTPKTSGTATTGENQSGSNTANDQTDNKQDGQGEQATTTEETVNRTINFVNAGADKGNYPSVTQTATVKVTNQDGKKSYDQKANQGVNWSQAAMPAHEGMDAYLNGQKINDLPTDTVVKADGTLNNAPLTITFVKTAQEPKKDPTAEELKNTDMYKTVTRTIKVTNPDQSETHLTQEVIFGRTISQDPKTGDIVKGDWQFLVAKQGNKNIDKQGATWAKYDIPELKGYISKYNDGKEDKFVTAIDAQDVKADTQSETINVVYVKASNQVKADPTKKDQQKDLWKAVTRTINYKLAMGTQEPTVQTVWFKRDKVTTLDANGKATEKYTEWAADGASTWDAFTISQLSYYHTEIDGTRGVQFAAKTVNVDMPNEVHTVTYVSDGTDPYNQRVVAGLTGNWASIDNIYMTDTGIHVTGWNANSDSYNRNYHYLIILDYGQNPVVGQYHEVGRKLVTGGVNRPDVFKVHPVWNAATSGFDDTVNLDWSQIKVGDKLRILSRWTNDANGNDDPADLVSSYYTMDYHTNLANLEGMKVAGNKLEVSGWNATNQRVGREYHYIILFDATTGREISRQLVKDGISRPDVAKVFPNILAASQSGFDVNFDVSGIDFSHNLQVISRYSDAANGEGSRVDYWFPAQRLVAGDTGNYFNLEWVAANNQKVTFKGWNATNLSQVEPNHFLILFDQTANQQVDMVKLDSKNGLVNRVDVQKVYAGIKNANQSGFYYTIDMSRLTFGHTYALVSRYSTSDQGNGGAGAYTDHWFSNAFTFNQQAYYIESASFQEGKAASRATDDKQADQTTDQKQDNGSQTPLTNTLSIQGWMASDAAANFKYSYVIVLDAKSNAELGRSQVELTDRSDVAKAYPSIYNSGKSGFKTSIDLSDANAELAKKDGIKFVLRYTNDKDGNGKTTADQWTTGFKYNQATNKFA
ncbi:mucin-binding protein [Limosilactobacillus oris]|uniref:mucin-binding protein n=1 Tax=Limosilactobacillus oris TaxID=1632 RepID=UPI0024B3C122|nr:KxYKxGKxW signal peptide domain-containing protein [Limosilactobacillus oris]WHO86078.1 KxYKxGKxW signal peptide domain-containing protein [Limosilactobacillus oris]